MIERAELVIAITGDVIERPEEVIETAGDVIERPEEVIETTLSVIEPPPQVIRPPLELPKKRIKSPYAPFVCVVRPLIDLDLPDIYREIESLKAPLLSEPRLSLMVDPPE
jgi:hypothetical protein